MQGKQGSPKKGSPKGREDKAAAGKRDKVENTKKKGGKDSPTKSPVLTPVTSPARRGRVASVTAAAAADDARADEEDAGASGAV